MNQTKETAPAQPGWCDGCSPDNCCDCGIAVGYTQSNHIKVVPDVSGEKAMNDKELLELAAKAVPLYTKRPI